jgi:hypothetical protein
MPVLQSSLQAARFDLPASLVNLFSYFPRNNFRGVTNETRVCVLAYFICARLN